MPSEASGDERPACDCPPNACRATRHKMARAAAFTSNSSGGKSLSVMSGGERTWIDACLTRAIALYLAQVSGRRHATLFSDEADEPLDP
jgi:exonuclease SbcC